MESAAGGGAEAQFTAIGMEYLRFAVDHEAYFEVMFRSEMHDGDDADLRAASERAFGILVGTVDAMGPGDPGGADPLYTAIGAWATVHGLATLWLDGALGQFAPGDLESIAQRVFEAGPAR